MKIFLTSLVFCFGFLLAHAQQDRFIYLQTENKQPFFVKLNNKVFNSFSSGYLIIPKLDDGLYSLIIGFPESTDQQEFNCSVNQRDVGFIIKMAGEKQWQLLNVQTNTVIVPGDVITKPVVIYEKETDAFSTMLANAVHDSTILRKDVAKTVLTEKPVEQLPKDTAASGNDITVSKNGLVTDSTGKDVAKEMILEKSGESIQKDTAQITSATDSTKNDITKATDIKRSNEVQKDSGQVVSTNEVVVLKPGTINDVAKETPANKGNETIQQDTTQTVLSNNNVTKSAKKKRSKKTDSALQEKDVVKQTTPEKATDIIQRDTAQISGGNEPPVTGSGKKKRSKKNDIAMQDAAVAQKDIPKEIVPEADQSKETVQGSAGNTSIVRSIIKRKSKKNSRDGVVMTYIDDNGETKDTITVLIPSEKNIKSEVGEPVVTLPVKDDTPKDNVTDKKAEYTITKEEKKIIKEANKEPVFISSMINSDCKNFASEEDFLKIRKKMVTENNDEDMIKAARKYFKTKCFTTEQIKNLSVLFLKDEGKYMFFDAAYPFVSDSEQYPGLEKQLSDDYYINRFRAMIHK